MTKKILIGLGVALGLCVLGGLGFVGYQVLRYNSSMARVYEVPLPSVAASNDPQVIARGQHLAESLGACTDCHGPDLGGRLVADMGPVGMLHAPNITSGGVGREYSDAELSRLLRDGIKRDGRSAVFMPSWDYRWWPEEDRVALISWWRTVPQVGRASEPTRIGVLGKVLDRLDKLSIDVARRIDHASDPKQASLPAPTAEYGHFIATLCQGCHGPTLSGGPIPGAPSSMAVPTNLTPHATGLAAWTEADFLRVINEGVRPDGRKLDPLMPVATLAAMNDTEKKALWTYLRSVPPKAFGGR